MKNMGKKIRYIAFFIGVCVLLAGCGKKFDASGYTKAVLDVSYKKRNSEVCRIKQGRMKRKRIKYLKIIFKTTWI